MDLLLRRVLQFGARRIVLALGYRSEAIVDYLNEHPIHDLAVETVVEPRPLGTAGAIRFGRARLRTDPVLIVNGDSFVDADLCAFYSAHRASGASGTILCAEVEDAGRYGRVLIDDQQRVSGFIEKDMTFRGSAFVNAGVYLFSTALLDQIASGDAVSLERDVFERLPPGSLAAFAGRFGFIDIGTPESLALADTLLREHVVPRA